MANNYTQYSTFVMAGEAGITLMRDAYHEAMQRYEAGEDDADGYPGQITVESDGIIFFESESADVGVPIAIIAEFQKKLGDQTPVTFEWANTCSKPRVGDFSGGGALIYKGEIYWFIPDDLAYEKYLELKKSEDLVKETVV